MIGIDVRRMSDIPTKCMAVAAILDFNKNEISLEIWDLESWYKRENEIF